MDATTSLAVRKQGLLFARVTSVLAIGLCLGIALSLVTCALMPAPHGIHRATWLRVLYWLPSIFYLWILLTLRRAFLDIADGALFGRSIQRALRQLGWCLIAGGILSGLLAPFIKPGPLPSGYMDARLVVFGIDDLDLVLAFVGVAVLLIARLLKAANEAHVRNLALDAEMKR